MAELILRLDDSVLECPEVVGIASHLRPYRLAWTLDSHPDLVCEKIDDLRSYEGDSDHTAYSIRCLELDADYLLVKNRGTNGIFYKKYKDFDFLLFSIAPTLEVDETYKRLIASLEGVNICSSLPTPSSPEDMNFIQCL